MSAKINASMKRISASLTLIASKVIAGDYDTIESLQAAQVNVQNAIASTESAFTVATKPATQGRKGIVAMATDAHDQLFANISEAQIKANLLNEALSADIQEMEDNLVEEPTEDIQVEDFSDGGDATQEEDTTVVPEVESMDHVEEVVEEVPVVDEVVEAPVVDEVAEPAVEEVVEEVEAAAPVADAPVVDDEVVDAPAPEIEAPEGDESLDDLIEEEEFSDVEGTLDGTLAEFTQVSALDHEGLDTDATESDAELEASESKANLKATVVASQASDNNLTALWNFKE